MNDFFNKLDPDGLDLSLLDLQSYPQVNISIENTKLTGSIIYEAFGDDGYIVLSTQKISSVTNRNNVYIIKRGSFKFGRI